MDRVRYSYTVVTLSCMYLSLGCAKMDNAEARSILAEKLSIYRQVPYADLATMVKSRAVHLESRGKSGTLYQVDISVYWDDEPAGDVRVLGAIDDGGWRPFFPLTDSFIKAPDNTFVDE